MSICLTVITPQVHVEHLKCTQFQFVDLTLIKLKKGRKKIKVSRERNMLHGNKGRREGRERGEGGQGMREKGENHS